jgi:hypothetical protein
MLHTKYLINKLPGVREVQAARGQLECVKSLWLIADMIIVQDLRLKVEHTRAIVGKEIQCSCCTVHTCRADNVRLLQIGLEKIVRSHKLETHEEMLPGIVQVDHSTTKIIILDWSAGVATCENLFPQQFSDFLPFFADSNGDLVMLSIIIPWDPGVCNELSTEVLQPELVEQHTSGEDHLGKHPGAQQTRDVYISYRSHARFICRIAHQHLSYWVLYEWILGNSMSTEKLRARCVQQQSGELVFAALSCDSFAGCICTWAVYWNFQGKCTWAVYCDCLVKCRGVQQQSNV